MKKKSWRGKKNAIGILFCPSHSYSMRNPSKIIPRKLSFITTAKVCRAVTRLIVAGSGESVARGNATRNFRRRTKNKTAPRDAVLITRFSVWRLARGTLARLCTHPFYTARQPRNFSGCRVLVKNAFGNAAHNFRLRVSKRRACRVLVSGRHSFLDHLDKTTDPASTLDIDRCLPFGFADTFFRRFYIGHCALKNWGS